ncbi:hypothetical protein [Streptomyces sp. cg40]|uniref:hypothetical protein n=1 Tax=Streptomyces sp. cg40 TaxID=3419764 RepID=UPI003D030F1D
MRQLGPPFGISKSEADRVMDHIAPLLASAPVRRRHPADTVLAVDGTLVPTRDRSVAASSRNHRCCTNHRWSSTPTPDWPWRPNATARQPPRRPCPPGIRRGPGGEVRACPRRRRPSRHTRPQPALAT